MDEPSACGCIQVGGHSNPAFCLIHGFTRPEQPTEFVGLDDLIEEPLVSDGSYRLSSDERLEWDGVEILVVSDSRLVEMSEAMMIGGRRGGRSTTHRRQTEWRADHGWHTHAIGHAGQWCVTRQPIGYLYERIPRERVCG
jgi:hypothetical protein